jgi:O-antigen/teichoic acid export membrane protein
MNLLPRENARWGVQARSLRLVIAKVTDNPSSVGARYARGVLWSLGGAIGSRSVMLATSITGARLLSASAFGTLGIVQNTVGMLGVLAGAGLGLTLTKYVSTLRENDFGQAKKYYELALAVACVTGILTTLALVLLSPLIATVVFNQESLGHELRIGAFLTLFGAVGGVQTGMLMGCEKFAFINVCSIAKSIITFVSTLLGAAYFGVTGALAALMLGEISAVLLNQHFVRVTLSNYDLGEQTTTSSPADFRHLLAFSIPALLSSLSTQPALWFSNSLLVRQPDGLEALGYFVAADRWRQLLLFLPSALSANTLPLLANLDGARNRSGFHRVLKINILLSGVAIVAPVVLTLFLSQTLMMFFGAQYESSWRTLDVLAISAVFMVINNVLGQMVVSRGFIWSRLKLDILLSAALFILSVLLVPAFLNMGLAFAHLGAYALASLTLVAFAVQLMSAETKSAKLERAAKVG